MTTICCLFCDSSGFKSILLSALGTSAGHIEELEDQISKLEEERDSLEVQIEKISREKEHQVERLNIENDTLSDKNNNLENKLTELESEIEELKAELNETKDSVPDQPTLAVEGEDISVSILISLLYTLYSLYIQSKYFLIVQCFIVTVKYINISIVHFIKVLIYVNSLEIEYY